MAPSPSPDPPLEPEDVELLLDIADDAIARALTGRRRRVPALDALPPALRARASAFVTLHVRGQLNGCIGAVDEPEPLGLAVARLALSAAFGDPRLPPLRAADYPDLMIEVSVLSPLEPVPATSMAELVARLRPGIDGVVVSSHGRRGLFLPVVWDQLPEPSRFVDHLWAKAGLMLGTWPAGTEIFRFTARRHERRAGNRRSSPVT